jgi:vitamin B12 transporter
MLRVKSNECYRNAATRQRFHFSLLLFFQPFNFSLMKKETKVWVLTLMTLWWLSPKQINAQQDTVRYLDELTISGARIEQPIIEVPRSVTLINKSTIENSSFNSVGELLATQPGISIVGVNQTPGTNQSLFLRGANSNQFAVLIDGNRITDPSSPNAAIDLSEVSLTDVERIEIISGGHSTLYGGSAIGGAINIITKKGGTPGFHGTASIQGGTFGSSSGTLNENVALNYGFKSGVYLSYSLFNQNVRGLNATEDTIRTPGVYKTTDRDDFRKTDHYLKAGYSKEKWDIAVSSKFSDQDADIDDGAYNDDDNAFVKFNRFLLNYDLTYKLNDQWSLSYLGSLSKSERINRNDSSLVNFDGNYDKTYFNGEYDGKLLTNELIARLKGNRLKGTFGAGQFAEEMNFETYYYSNAFGFPYESKVNYDSIDTRTTTNYAFAQLGYDLGNFGITVGGRYSNHSKFGGNFTYEVSPSYKLNDMLLYASFSSGFNAPSLYQLYDQTRGFGAYTSKGNPGLKPEESVSFEIGIKKEFKSGSYFTASAFTSQTENAIEYVYLWQKGKPVEELGFAEYAGDTYINVTEQMVRGVEVTGHVMFSKFYLNGNVTFMDGEVRMSPGDIDADHTGDNYVQSYNYGVFLDTDFQTSTFQRRPMFTGTGELGYRFSDRFTVFSIVRQTGKRYDVVYDETLGPFGALGRSQINSFTLVDLGAQFRLNKSLTLSGKVDNIFDADYQEILGFQTRGTSAYLKVLYKW